MTLLRNKVVLVVTLMLLIGAVAACGPATPSAEEVDSSDDAASTENEASEEGSSETPTEEVSPAEEESEGEGEQEAPSLEGSFDIYGGADAGEFIETESGLQYIIYEEGEGALPEVNQVVSVHYTGYLTDGTIFDSSRDRGQPFGFPLGQGAVIAGWDEGIGYLPVGSTGRLIIPSELAYGDTGAGGLIQPGDTLVFDVELVEILPDPPDSPTAVEEDDYLQTELGVQYYEIEEGSGEEVADGQVATMHYTGWLEDGTMFDSSLLRGQAVPIMIGAGQLIPGWEDGMLGMKAGGVRQIVLPPELAFGEEGAGGGLIPPNATLILQIEIVDVSPPQ